MAKGQARTLRAPDATPRRQTRAGDRTGGGVAAPAPRASNRRASSVETVREARSRTGSDEAFEREAVPHLDALYGLALRLTGGRESPAEDLVQDTMLRAFRAWHTYERGTNCRAWLMRILRNAFINDYRRRRARRSDFEYREEIRHEVVDDAIPWSRSPETPSEALFDRLVDARVVEAIDGLSEKHRVTIVLSDLLGLGYQEVADEMGVPVGTVKSRLFRARRALRDRLRAYAEEMGYIGTGG